MTAIRCRTLQTLLGTSAEVAVLIDGRTPTTTTFREPRRPRPAHRQSSESSLECGRSYPLVKAFPRGHYERVRWARPLIAASVVLLMIGTACGSDGAAGSAGQMSSSAAAPASCRPEQGIAPDIEQQTPCG